MMRVIHGHEINECNETITIEADEPSHGGASHAYSIGWVREDGTRRWATLPFQIGPIKEAGTNGVTHEALLTIIKDRLLGFQSGEWACPENEAAIKAIDAVMEILAARTKGRDERGVEGTWEK